jgi:hypothetical protein
MNTRNTTKNSDLDGMLKRLQENTGMNLQWEHVPESIYNLYEGDVGKGRHHNIKTVIGKTAFYEVLHGMSCIIEEMRAANRVIEQ